MVSECALQGDSNKIASGASVGPMCGDGGDGVGDNVVPVVMISNCALVLQRLQQAQFYCEICKPATVQQVECCVSQCGLGA